MTDYTTQAQEPMNDANDAAQRQALRANAMRIMQASQSSAILQHINKNQLKGRGFFDEYDSGVIMKWGTGVTRRHIWLHIEGDAIRIRLREHLRCSPEVTRAACDGEYHTYVRELWSDTPYYANELQQYYDHPVAETSDD